MLTQKQERGLRIFKKKAQRGKSLHLFQRLPILGVLSPSRRIQVLSRTLPSTFKKSQIPSNLL